VVQSRPQIRPAQWLATLNVAQVHGDWSISDRFVGANVVEIDLGARSGSVWQRARMRHSGIGTVGWALAALCGAGCGVSAIDGTRARDGFARTDEVWAGPFPRPALFDDAGRPRLDAFPNPGAVSLVDHTLRLLSETVGASQSGGVFFPFDGPLDAASLTIENAGILAVSGASRPPVRVAFRVDGGPFGAPNLLVILARSGVLLAPDTEHVAFVTREVRAADGTPIGRSQVMADLLADRENAGISAEFRLRAAAAVRALEAAGIPRDSVAALTVFRTGNAAADFSRVVAHDRTLTTPAPGTFEKVESFEKFCVYRALVEQRVYQRGTPPFASSGGDWRFDASGIPVVDHVETARVFVTIPRKTPSNSMLPIALFVRTGGGGDRPLIDRGLRAEPLGDTTPGTGPANWFADAGWAGVQVDGPHGGPRNVSNGDEQFLMFNVLNPAALRDNVRQSALELVRLLDGIGSWRLDASDCEGVGSSGNSLQFDASRAVVLGHSMGATIAPLVLAETSGVAATILSGAGASYLENVVHKEKPIAVKPVAEELLGYSTAGRSLDVFDPVLSLVQWAADPADPPAYLARVPDRTAALVFQGIVDHYILPPMANALALPMSLRPAGQTYDRTDPRLANYEPISSLLPAEAPRALPVDDALDSGARVLVQLEQDAIEDGHEVMYQRPEAARAVSCFLGKLLQNRVVVNLDGCE